MPYPLLFPIFLSLFFFGERLFGFFILNLYSPNHRFGGILWGGYGRIFFSSITRITLFFYLFFDWYCFCSSALTFLFFERKFSYLNSNFWDCYRHQVWLQLQHHPATIVASGTCCCINQELVVCDCCHICNTSGELVMLYLEEHAICDHCYLCIIDANASCSLISYSPRIVQFSNDA